MKTYTTVLLPLAAMLAFPFSPACADETRVFVLGRIDTQQGHSDSIDMEEIRRHDRVTVGDAVDLLPGVSLSKQGQRNEQMLWLRGFNLRQVPVYLDGIPIYVPYDGYADLGRFTTFDVARIDVAKGYSSALYGANTMGGAINLISRRPVQRFEGDAGAGLSFDSRRVQNGERAYVNLGSNQGEWYLQAGLSYVNQEFYRLPDGSRRDNSLTRDDKVNLRAGYTPNASDEYALNYIRQSGRKYDPPYAGRAATVSPVYWQWPYWDKESVYFLSTTQFGAHALKLRLYHDGFRNSLAAFDDANYNSMKKPSSFNSMYDDDTSGASVQGDFKLSAAHTLRASYNIKTDVHREANAGEPLRRFEDRTTTFALEGTHVLLPRFTLGTGISYEKRESLAAQDYIAARRVIVDFPRAGNARVNGQAGAFYKLEDGGELHATFARKSRFPTIKDRYSYRMGRGIPNPALEEESADHYEAGWGGKLAGWRVDANVFHSAIRNLIQNNTLASLCNGARCMQNQNIGKSAASGVELSGRKRYANWELDANYTWLHRSLRSNPGLVLTETPKHKAFASALWRANDALELGASARSYSRRYSSSDGLQVASGFTTVDLKAGYRLASHTRVETGARNAFDRLYAYAEGYPEAGRGYFLQVASQW